MKETWPKVCHCQLIFNGIRTPDGTILQSRHRHDYKTHLDDNGHVYMVDGGLDYLRRHVPPKGFEYEELSLNADHLHSKIRELVDWGTYGKDGDQPFKRVLLKDMTDDHCRAIIRADCGEIWKKLMEDELDYRYLQGRGCGA